MKKTVCQRLMISYKKNKGVRLSAEDVRDLVMRTEHIQDCADSDDIYTKVEEKLVQHKNKIDAINKVLTILQHEQFIYLYEVSPEHNNSIVVTIQKGFSMFPRNVHRINLNEVSVKEIISGFTSIYKQVPTTND